MDAERMSRRLDRALRYPGVNYHDYMDGHVFDRAAYDRACAIIQRHQDRIFRARQTRKKEMQAAGWPYHTCRDWWEADHIIPFSEGGETVLENMRTLCYPCHKHRTKKWHGDRKAARREPDQMVLLTVAN